MHEPPLELWFWTVTDEVTRRRRQTRYRMTQADALERFGADAVKIEGSLEVRVRKGGHTSDFLSRALLPMVDEMAGVRHSLARNCAHFSCPCCLPAAELQRSSARIESEPTTR